MLVIAGGNHHSVQLRHGQQLLGVLERFDVTAEAALAVRGGALAVQGPNVAYRHNPQVLLLLTHFHHIPMTLAASAAPPGMPD